MEMEPPSIQVAAELAVVMAEGCYQMERLIHLVVQAHGLMDLLMVVPEVRYVPQQVMADLAEAVVVEILPVGVVADMAVVVLPGISLPMVAAVVPLIMDQIRPIQRHLMLPEMEAQYSVGQLLRISPMYSQVLHQEADPVQEQGLTLMPAQQQLPKQLTMVQEILHPVLS